MSKRFWRPQRSDVVEANPLPACRHETSKIFAVSGHDLGVEGGGEGHDYRIADVRRPGPAQEQSGAVSAVFVEHGDVAASEKATELNLLW